MRSRPGKVRPKSGREELAAAGLLLEAPGPGELLDLPSLFGNRRPVEAEIGPGKGAFLIRRAAARPDVNVLGIEWVRAYAVYAADRALRRGLRNARVLCADAGDLFQEHLPARCLWRVHVYFPDPWPKRRHRSRRLLNPAFLAALRRTLRLGAWLGIVTDHEDYFRGARRAVAVTAGLVEIPFRAPGGAHGRLVGTNFERRYAHGEAALHTIAAIRFR